MNGSKYFEDIKKGEIFHSGRRTITETDLVLFLNLMRLNNPLFSDQGYAESSTFQGKVVPGPLVTGMAISLIDNLGLFWGTLVALVKVQTDFVAPVKVGDTIHVESIIEEKNEMPRSDRGLIILNEKVFNQNDKSVITIKRELLIKRKRDNSE